MLPFFAAAAPVIGSLAAGIFSSRGQHSANRVNREMTEAANEQTRNMAREQMQFQERMANTSWQRGMADMKKAGLNPIRAFSDAAADKSSAIGKHPQDFTLFELGEFDSTNATFGLHSSPISCGVAIEFLGSEDCWSPQ